MRLKNYSSIGLSNRKVDWGLSYKIKVGLQCLMLVTLCCHAVPAFMDNQHYFFRVCAVIQQLVVWVISLLMWRFEYKRALGHTWYLHPLLFGYCAFYYSAQILIQIKFLIIDTSFVYYIILGLQVLFSLILTVLTIKYPNDNPHLIYTQEFRADVVSERLLYSEDEFRRGSVTDRFSYYKAQNSELPKIIIKMTEYLGVGKEEIVFQIRTYTVGGGLQPLKLNVKKTFTQFEQLDE